ncbi:shikimate kinase [Planctomycetota bacterium]|nr:shikimate kinase [Planctomycetota bacterium]
MKIILFGYRGSGKSTVGKHIADRLGWPLIDTDHEIMLRFGGMSIAEIWNDFGEPVFREKECRVTEDVCQKDECVISLGGGTVMQLDAMRAIEACEDTLRIYLSAPAEVLHKRIVGDENTQDNRPALTSHGISLDEVKQVLSEREPTYQAVADYMIDVSDATIEEVAEQIMAILQG